MGTRVSPISKRQKQAWLRCRRQSNLMLLGLELLQDPGDDGEGGKEAEAEDVESLVVTGGADKELGNHFTLHCGWD